MFILALLTLLIAPRTADAGALEQLQTAAGSASSLGSAENLSAGAGRWSDANAAAKSSPVAASDKASAASPAASIKGKAAPPPNQAPRSPFSYSEPGRPRWNWTMPIRGAGDFGVSFLGFAVFVGIMVACAFIGAAIIPGVGGTIGAGVGLVAGALLTPVIMRALGF